MRELKKKEREGGREGGRKEGRKEGRKRKKERKKERKGLYKSKSDNAPSPCLKPIYFLEHTNIKSKLSTTI